MASDTHNTDDTGEQPHPNSGLYWHEVLAEISDSLTPVSLPETISVEYDFRDSLPLANPETSPEELPNIVPWEEFQHAANLIGTPVFVRSDIKSAKHRGLDGTRLDETSIENIGQLLHSLTKSLADNFAHPNALMFREWVDINAEFRAFGGLKIGREYRLFATPDELLCHHFYWPDDTFNGLPNDPSPLDCSNTDKTTTETLPKSEWQQDLQSLNTLPNREQDILSQTAKTAVSALNSSHPKLPAEIPWSLDFAEDTDGDWWLIDCALGVDSWHPESCPNEFTIDND
jgi:hypothetical protein